MSLLNVNECAVTKCPNFANKRCSRCKSVYYCSVEHQKEHWVNHKSLCIIPITASSSSSKKIESVNSSSSDSVDKSSESRVLQPLSILTTGEKECRCMFCGDLLLLSSEEAAVDHMAVCAALQEQLNSNTQFTIPSEFMNNVKL